MIVPILVFAGALALALFGKRRGLRLLVASAVVLAPMRGGLQALAGDIGLADPGLTVNALVPAMVAALAIGVVWTMRPRLSEISRPLLVGWTLIALVAILNFPGQDVGVKIYGVGLAQYLVYPTLAIAAWPLYEAGDLRKLSRLFIAMGALVSVTVLLQAAGVEGFIQAASAEIEGFAANRYAGITGSYLHTSAFLGVIAVLVMGELLEMRSAREMVAGSALLALVLSGQILTFSRSGVVIAGIGAVALFALDARRRAFVAMLAPAVAVALVVGWFGGVNPGDAGARIGSGFDPAGDEGNSLRGEAFGDGVDRFLNATPARKVVGEGLGATGNARKLVAGDVFAVESYYLKLLVEVGLVGLVAVGAFLVWAAYAFARAAWARRPPWLGGVAMAGFGLSLYNIIYPALETQILALTWWLLLAICLRAFSDGLIGNDAERADAVDASSEDLVLVS